jgi:hypothetical protein
MRKFWKFTKLLVEPKLDLTVESLLHWHTEIQDPYKNDMRCCMRLCCIWTQIVSVPCLMSRGCSKISASWICSSWISKGSELLDRIKELLHPEVLVWQIFTGSYASAKRDCWISYSWNCNRKYNWPCVLEFCTSCFRCSHVCLLQHLRSLTTWEASTAMKLRQICRLGIGMNSAWESLWEAVQ